MKRYIVLAVIAAVIFSFASCGKELKETEEEEASSIITASGDQTSDAAESTDYEKIYKPKLDMYYDYLTLDIECDEMPGLMGIWDINTDCNAHMAGYTVKDISGDGVPELIIAEYSDNKTVNNILAVYTVEAGEPKLVSEGWSRSTCHIMPDGTFRHIGSGGAAYYEFGSFSFSGDGTEKIWSEHFIREGDDCYTDKKEGFDTENAEKIDLETLESKYDEYNENEGIYLEVTPFDEYTAPDYGENPVLSIETELYPETDPDRCTEVVFEKSGADYLIISTDSAVRNFRLIKLTAEESDNENGFAFAGNTIYSSYLFSPDRPLKINPQFNGDLPEYGISYIDGSGKTNTFAITQSGEDGSIILRPIELSE